MDVIVTTHKLTTAGVVLFWFNGFVAAFAFWWLVAMAAQYHAIIMKQTFHPGFTPWFWVRFTLANGVILSFILFITKLLIY